MHNMLYGGPGNVAVESNGWGVNADPMRRNLGMRIRRTPHAVVAETQPQHVADWGQYGISPNGQITSFSGAADDAVIALEKAGKNGAAALGALFGLVFASSKITGALVGGLLGYFGGSYIVSTAKRVLVVQQVVSAVTPSTSSKVG
jgi:hypothetical protein